MIEFSDQFLRSIFGNWVLQVRPGPGFSKFELVWAETTSRAVIVIIRSWTIETHVLL